MQTIRHLNDSDQYLRLSSDTSGAERWSKRLARMRRLGPGYDPAITQEDVALDPGAITRERVAARLREIACSTVKTSTNPRIN